MNRYSIMFECTNFDIFDEIGNRLAGFYVTVNLLAQSADDACQNAIKLLTECERFQGLFEDSQHPNGVVAVSECVEVPASEDFWEGVSGFAFYSENDSQAKSLLQ